EQNTTAGERANEQGAEERVAFYSTREEAEPNRPASAKSDSWKVFEVTRPDGTSVFLWAFTGINAVNAVARADGYAAVSGRKTAVTKETVAAKLASFTDEELAALGLSRKPAKGGKR